MYKRQGVYRSIDEGKNIFIQAPTGTGKTLGTLFPSIKAMGQGNCGRIFYLTAKTITRTVAEDTGKLLQEKGLRMKFITLTAKEKICPLEECLCQMCIRDRVTDTFVLSVEEANLTSANTDITGWNICISTNMTAVSYTHLDVYKRQVYNRPCQVARVLNV